MALWYYAFLNLTILNIYMQIIYFCKTFTEHKHILLSVFYGVTMLHTLSLLCVHIFQTTCRKDFRPAYSKLGSLGSVLPGKPIVGLTATATKEAKLSIAHSLGMINPVIIEVSPDRRKATFKAF